MDEQQKHTSEEQLLIQLINNIPDVVYFKDKAGRLVHVNNAHAAGLGLEPEDVVGKTDHHFFPKDQADKMVRDDYKVMETGKPIIDRIERTTQPNGTHHCVSTTKLPWRDKHGNIIGIMGITRDITERTRREEQRIAEQMKAEKELKTLKNKLQFEKEKLEEILRIEEELNSIVNPDKLINFVVDKTTKILNAEKCSLMLAEKDSEELYIKGFKGLGTNVPRGNRMVNGDSISGYVIRLGKPVLVYDIEKDERFLRKNRSGYQSKSFMSVPMRINNHMIGVINVADKNDKEDQSFTQVDLNILKTLARQVCVAMENAHLYKQLNYLTISDPLTNMYNYRYFAKSLDDELKRMRRYKENLCLLMIDVDNFKEYNDTYGHVEGDTLLKQIGKILKNNLREVDIACRYAGDEFVVILPKTEAKEALIVAKKLNDKIKETALKMPVTFSIGIAQSQENIERHGLVLQADSALYSAKRNGKDQACVYQEGHSAQMKSS